MTAPLHSEPSMEAVIIERYEGGYLDGKYHGMGTAWFKGSHLYVGEFVNGVMHGTGKYVWSDGVEYEGQFTDNEVSGYGTYRWADGSKYVGEVKNGLRHGQGTFTCGNLSTVYAGSWFEGRRHGKGRLVFDREGLSYYDGDWVHNKKEGSGIMRYKTGNMYDGEWRNNIRHGKGAMHWYDSSERYQGDWENGVQHGKGEHVWFHKRAAGASHFPLCNKYVGEWHNGKRHGLGTFYFASGAQYCGEWRENVKDGQGLYTFEDGSVYEGEFIADRMARLERPLSGNERPVPGDTKQLSGRFRLHVQALLPPVARLDSIVAKEEEQLHNVITRHISLLRTVYRCYSMLGASEPLRASPSPTATGAGSGDGGLNASSLPSALSESAHLLTRTQFWRFVKDCRLHHHPNVSLARLDRRLALNYKDSPLTISRYQNPHAPDSPFLLREFIDALVSLAYMVYGEGENGLCSVYETAVCEKGISALLSASLGMGNTSAQAVLADEKQKDVLRFCTLARCFSNLIVHDVLPNAGKVGGNLFRSEAAKLQAFRPQMLAAAAHSGSPNSSVSMSVHAQSHAVPLLSVSLDTATAPIIITTGEEDDGFVDQRFQDQYAEAVASVCEMVRSPRVLQGLAQVFRSRATRRKFALADAEEDVTFTVRQFLFVIKDSNLLGKRLTPAKIISIFSEENPFIADGDAYNLEAEIVFLEFVEALIGCALAKIGTLRPLRTTKESAADAVLDTDGHRESVVDGAPAASDETRDEVSAAPDVVDEEGPRPSASVRRLDEDGRSSSMMKVTVGRSAKGPVGDVAREDRKTAGSAKSNSRRNSAGVHEVRDSQMITPSKRQAPDTPAARNMGKNYFTVYRQRGSNLCVFEGVDGFDPKMISYEFGDAGAAAEDDAAEQAHVASEDDSDVDYDDCEDNDAVFCKWRAKVDRFFERVITPCGQAPVAAVASFSRGASSRAPSDTKTLNRAI